MRLKHQLEHIALRLFLPAQMRIQRNRRISLDVVWSLRCLHLGPLFPHQSLILGGWSMGPQMYFILNVLFRKESNLKCLEFGSGQSSLFIQGVEKEFPGTVARHVVLEHDKFFADKAQQGITEAVVAPITQGPEGGARYDWLPDIDMSGFQVIVVDGPFGSRRLSRNNVMDLLNDSLPLDFVILMDDTHRPGERETEMRVMDRLREMKRSPIRRRYQGSKILTVITSKNSRFAYLVNYHL